MSLTLYGYYQRDMNVLDLETGELYESHANFMMYMLPREDVCFFREAQWETGHGRILLQLELDSQYVTDSCPTSTGPLCSTTSQVADIL